MSVRVDSNTDRLERSLWATANVPTANPWTIMGWFRIINTRAGTDATLFQLGAGGNDYYVQLAASDGHTLEFYDGGGYDSETFALTVGTWYHLAVTRNTSSGAMSVYVDGTLRVSNSQFNALGGVLLTIGYDPSGGQWSDCEFCDFRVWQVELTSGEVATEKASTTPVKASPYVVYRLANAATAATDSSGNSRSATISGLTDGASEPAIYGGGASSFPPVPGPGYFQPLLSLIAHP